MKINWSMTKYLLQFISCQRDKFIFQFFSFFSKYFSCSQNFFYDIMYTTELLYELKSKHNWIKCILWNCFLLWYIYFILLLFTFSECLMESLEWLHNLKTSFWCWKEGKKNLISFQLKYTCYVKCLKYMQRGGNKMKIKRKEELQVMCRSNESVQCAVIKDFSFYFIFLLCKWKEKFSEILLEIECECMRKWKCIRIFNWRVKVAILFDW